MEELKKLLEALAKAQEDFRAATEERFEAIEQKGHADPLLTEQVMKIAQDVGKLEGQIQAKTQQLDAVEKAVALAAAPPGGGGNRTPRVYSSIGHQLLDVARAANPDVSGSARAEAIGRLSKVRAAATGANEGIPSEGGFLVEKDMSNVLSEAAIATGLLSRRCFYIPISANANGLKANLMDETSRANGSRYGGIQVYHAAEAATVTATKPKWRKFEMELHKLFGLMYATDELLQDATALSALVNRWFPGEFGFKLDDVIVSGSGAGQGLGILNSGATVSVPKETGQAAATVAFENIVKMDARLLDSSENSAIWLINRDIKPSLATMTLAVGTGGVPVYLPANAAAGRPFNTLYGREMLSVEQCSTLGTVGDIILADLNEMVFIDKGGIQSAVSIHVQFIYDEQVFRWTYRYDCQPLRKSPLTPYKGSNTRGPFVTVATRS